MNLLDTIAELNALIKLCSSQEYISHYTIECKYKKLVKNLIYNQPGDKPADLEEYKKLKIDLEKQIEMLKKSNKKLITELDFHKTCLELINKNDVPNLEGLIRIGEYFGVGKNHWGVSGQLDIILDEFKRSANKRKLSNKTCLDYLCNLLREPILDLPQTNFNQYQNSRNKIKAIINANSTQDLMVWMIDARQENLDFSLRFAASKSASFDCLMFLLIRTKKSPPHVPSVNLIAPGKISGQIAMHRVISSGDMMNLTLFLNEKTNPNDNLLKQLLVCDHSDATPIDLIKELRDKNTQASFITHIRKIINKHGNTPRFGLSAYDIQSIHKQLDKAANTNQHTNTPGNIKLAILECVKKDDDVELNKLLVIYESKLDKNIKAYALRTSSCGAIKCLKALVHPTCQSLTEPGETSGKIALHFAMNHKIFEEKNYKCIKTLLNAVNHDNCIDPLEQLFFSDKTGIRPIDQLWRIGDKNIDSALKVIDIIQDAVNASENNGNQYNELLLMIKNIKNKVSERQVMTNS